MRLKVRLTDITKWTSTPDGYGGHTYAAPVTIQGRWEDVQELFRDSKGEETVSEAVVFIDNRYTIEVGDFLLNGVSASTTPSSVTGVKQVRAVHTIPDLRRLSNVAKAVL